MGCDGVGSFYGWQGDCFYLFSPSYFPPSWWIGWLELDFLISGVLFLHQKFPLIKRWMDSLLSDSMILSDNLSFTPPKQLSYDNPKIPAKIFSCTPKVFFGFTPKSKYSLAVALYILLLFSCSVAEYEDGFLPQENLPIAWFNTGQYSNLCKFRWWLVQPVRLEGAPYWSWKFHWWVAGGQKFNIPFA